MPSSTDVPADDALHPKHPDTVTTLPTRSHWQTDELDELILSRPVRVGVYVPLRIVCFAALDKALEGEL